MLFFNLFMILGSIAFIYLKRSIRDIKCFWSTAAVTWRLLQAGIADR